MNLLVIRHAIAEDKKLLEDDATRRLTNAGEKKFKGVVRGIKKLGWKLDRVFSSPWLRAARTAELLETLGGGVAIETDLLTKSPRAELLALISEYAGGAEKNRAVAVVGHEPWLGELIAWLAFGDGRHGEGLVLKKRRRRVARRLGDAGWHEHSRAASAERVARALAVTL